MSYGRVPPFSEPVTLKFHERVNVFVGPNASGKSTLLQAIDECLNRQVENRKRPLSQGRRELLRAILGTDEEFDDAVSGEWGDRNVNYLAASEDWTGTREQYISTQIPPPAIYIASFREELPSISEELSPDKFGGTAEETLGGPFSGSRTYCAYQLLSEELWNSQSGATPRKDWGTLNDAEGLANACAKRICDEVIADSRSHNYVHGPDHRGYLRHLQAHPGVIPVKRRMGVNTNDIRNFDSLPLEEEPSYSAYDPDRETIPIYMGHLSSGTEGTLLWIRWLALKLVHYYGFEEGWEKKPAILLIDEIENHLHPTWQRRVIPALLDHFPGLQIFATTHSPFVVAGLKAGQVHLLKRDENGVVTYKPNSEDIVGWTADEILRNLMGVEEPTDQLTVDRANRLRQLREKEPLSAEEESELAELRRQVNEALLSKEGQLGAQQERYADLMERFLLSRQSGPTQDGELAP